MKKVITLFMLLTTLSMSKEVYRTKYIIDKSKHITGKFWGASDLDKKINKFLKSKDDTKGFEVIDVKLSDNDEYPSALVIYKEDEE